MKKLGVLNEKGGDIEGAAQLAGQARAKARALKFNNKIFKY